MLSSLPTPVRHHLPRRVLAALSGPSITSSALSLPLVAFLPEFYSGSLGLSLALVGTVFMVVRLLDIVVDPLLGGLMDRTHTPMGRYRPWLILAAPLIMVSMAMLFMAKPGVGAFHLMGWLLVAYAGWSVLSLSQLALAANVSPDYHERSRIYGWWQIAFFIGMIVSMLTPKLIANMGFTSASAGMQGMAWLVIIGTPIFIAIAVLVVRERPIPINQKGGGLREYFGLMRNRTVQSLLSCEALLGIAGGATSTLTIFYFTRVAGLSRVDVGILFIGTFVAGLLVTPLWSRLANRIGKHRALAAAAIVSAVAQSLFLLLPHGNFYAALAVQASTGIAYGAISLLTRAMTADISDEERLRTGQERTGLLYALLIGVWKVGQAVSVGGMFYLLSLVGFSAAENAVNPASALLGLQVLFIGIPIVLSLCAAWVAWRYPLTPERHLEIRIQLEARDAEVHA